MTDGSPSSEQLDVLDAARAFSRDRYLSALLAPRQAQNDLVVLAAFLGEIKRVSLMVREAVAGEIRLQWWRDALQSAVTSGHPVADAMRRIIDVRGLDRADCLSLIEGYGRELYEDGVSDVRELDSYVDETEGATFRLSLALLGEPQSSVAKATRWRDASRALALSRLAITLPQHLAHGRLPVPQEYLRFGRDPRGLDGDAARDATRVLMEALADDARASIRRVRASTFEPDVFPAVLPMSLLEPTISAALKSGRDVLSGAADISPLSRIWRLWFAHWRGKV